MNIRRFERRLISQVKNNKIIEATYLSLGITQFKNLQYKTIRVIEIWDNFSLN